MQNKDIVKAWLDGAAIQKRCKKEIFGGNTWDDCLKYENDFSFNFNFEFFEYRIKPEVQTLTYRVALLHSQDNDTYWTKSCIDAEYKLFEESKYFVRWISEEQTVEI